MEAIVRLSAKIDSGRWPVTALGLTLLSLLVTVAIMPGDAYYDIFVYRYFGTLLFSDPFGSLNPLGGSVQPYPTLIAPILAALSAVPASLAVPVYTLAVALPAASVTMILVHRIAPMGRVAAIWLSVMTLVMGAGYWFRLEPIIAALLTAGLVASVGRHGGRAFLWTALAAGAKLIPVTGFLAYPFPVKRPALKPATIAAAAGLLILAADMARTLWITFGRQMQIEAIPALPLLAARALGNHEVVITYVSELPDMCVVVLGPQSVLFMLSLAGTLLTVAGVAFTGWRLWRVYGSVAGDGAGWRARLSAGSRAVAPQVQVAAVLAATAAVLFGGKVFSPQYVALLAVPAAIYFALTRDRLVLAATTSVVVTSFILWPYYYNSLGTYSLLPVAILAVRASATVAVFVVAVRRVR